MRRTKRSRARVTATTLPPLVAMLVVAHLLNPLFGLASGERELFDSLVLEAVVCGGFGMLTAQASLLGLWATLASGRFMNRLAITLLLLALLTIAPVVLHGNYVTIRYMVLPYLGIVLFTPLRWFGLQLRRRVQPDRHAHERAHFPLLQLLCAMLATVVLLAMNASALLTARYDLSEFDYQVAGFSVAYTLLLSIVICTDFSRGVLPWFFHAVALVALAILPSIELHTFAQRYDFELLVSEFLLPLHGAQCAVVLVSLLVIRADGYRLERLPYWMPWRLWQLVLTVVLRPPEVELELVEREPVDLEEAELLEGILVEGHNAEATEEEDELELVEVEPRVEQYVEQCVEQLAEHEGNLPTLVLEGSSANISPIETDTAEIQGIAPPEPDEAETGPAAENPRVDEDVDEDSVANLDPSEPGSANPGR